MPPKKKTQSVLVRWIIDESVGVMPSTSVKTGQIQTVGAFVDAKYDGKFYEAEILKISSKY